METNATIRYAGPTPAEMLREVHASNLSLRKVFARYNAVKVTLKLLESHPATPHMEITLRLRRHKEWLHKHICRLLEPAAGKTGRIAA